MKKIISLLFVLLLTVSVIAYADQVSAVDVFVRRYNDCMAVFYKAFHQKYAPVEAMVTQTGELMSFVLELPNGRLEGTADAERIIAADVQASDISGSLYIMGATAAVSSMVDVSDIMDPAKQLKYLSQTADPDVVTTNGYVVEITERFKSGEAKRAIITLLP